MCKLAMSWIMLCGMLFGAWQCFAQISLLLALSPAWADGLSAPIAMSRIGASGAAVQFPAQEDFGGGRASYTPIYADAQNINRAGSIYVSPSEAWPAGTAVVAVFSNATFNDFRVTINGVTATQIGKYSVSGQKGSLWQAPISAGCGTVVVRTLSDLLGVIATARGVVATRHPTPTSNQEADMSSEPEPVGTVTTTIPIKGVGVVFAATTSGSTTPLPCTWTTLADSSTEFWLSGAAGICGAHSYLPGSTTPTVSTSNGTFGYQGGVGAMLTASWGP